jgi:hypothetical protein
LRRAGLRLALYLGPDVEFGLVLIQVDGDLPEIQEVAAGALWSAKVKMAFSVFQPSAK